MNRIVVALLVLLAGCASEPRPPISAALSDLEAALARAVQVSSITDKPVRTPGNWPCGLGEGEAFQLEFTAPARDPRASVVAVVELWRREGLTVQVDQSRHPDLPEVIVRGRLIEMSIYGFPDRGTVWIAGNTACLDGEVPAAWRDV
ncbi:hypothetical protein [Herbidospora mongoliensis]|uniref:hypothetical protein n=1 Tax=Herbidospora mongoliensis TaxID=688067 RepID=UPI0012FBCCFA|nr:hypothetical protein [Herbidospora mongoliensis]